jgi:hypothetical protein
MLRKAESECESQFGQGPGMNRAQRRYLDATVRPGIHNRPTVWAKDDAKWFERRPDWSHRVRDRFPGEEFGWRVDPTLDLVAVKQITTGLRARSPFEIPPSRCAKSAIRRTGLRFCSTGSAGAWVRSGATISKRSSIDRGSPVGAHIDHSEIKSARRPDHRQALGLTP